MMLLGAFCFVLISMFFGTVAALPWGILYEGWKERSPGTIMAAGMFCILELAMIGDWLMGYA